MDYTFRSKDIIKMKTVEEKEYIRKMLDKQNILRASWATIDKYWEDSFYPWWLGYLVKERYSWELSITQSNPSDYDSIMSQYPWEYNIIQASDIINGNVIDIHSINYLNLLAQ